MRKPIAIRMPKIHTRGPDQVTLQQCRGELLPPPQLAFGHFKALGTVWAVDRLPRRFAEWNFRQLDNCWVLTGLKFQHYYLTFNIHYIIFGHL
jgi:hypothetical protein